MNNPSPTTELLMGYSAREGTVDEAFVGEGRYHGDWEYLLNSLASLGEEELNNRRLKAMRMLRDDGATYNVYSQVGADNAWNLDLVPFLISSEDWGKVEAGLQERAELFNFILNDIYGSRELITRGIVPPELIFGHKSFIRACQAIKLPGEHQLIIHATDMMRQPDGSMCIVADRCQAPSGSGYALENRSVMSQVMPSLFRESHVHRLAGYFQILRKKLIDLAPGVSSPQIVILTPGPYNEAYFEHAFLANYLGFSLVQSNDLIVKNGNVWMRSLDGLKRVDVILRRVDDYFCDPAELKSDSQLGVAGLLEVARSGRVAIANPLGSGILENPALLSYLPQISQHFLGRNLRLNSVATWWCGNPDHYQHVLANLDQMIIKPVFRTPNVSSVVVSELDDQQRSQLLTQLASRPVNFVAQEKLTPSSMPLFDGQQLSPRPTILRTYAVADASSYRVMPGGLTRVGISEDSSLISNQLGSVSKDTWVLASEPEPQASALDDVQEIEAAANLMSLPSRVVENLFWLGRYGERAENGLRLLRTAFNHINGGSDLSEAARTRLLYAVTHQTATYPGFVNDPSKLNDAHAELIDVLTNASRSGSIRQCIDAMLACAEESKGLFSSDGQRIINDIRDEVSGLGSSANTTGSYGLEQSLNQMISRLMALSAIIQESMVRGTGWRFVEIGRRLERSLQIVYLLRATLTHEMSGEDKSTLLECVLRSIESLVACQRRFPGSLSVRNTLDMSLLDSTNPRSILFQLNELVDHIDHLPLGAPRGELEKEQRCALEALNLVRLSQLDNLAYPKDGEGVLSDLDQMFSRLTYLLTETSNHLSARFFVHEQQLRQLVDQRLDY